MEVFVILALTLAVFAVGMVVVAVVVLRQQLRTLTEALRGTSEQVRTLVAELDDEAAVLSLESDALQRRLAEGRGHARPGYTAGDRRAPAGS